MRRTTIEKRLRTLGWQPSEDGGVHAGVRHVLWRRPRERGVLVVPQFDLFDDVLGELLLARARR
jgi:hypothetical protein